MSQPRDPDDFLDWAPDLGFWDAPLEPAAGPPPQPPVVSAPPPSPQAPTLRSVPARTAPPAPTPSQGPRQRPASRMLVPLIVAFAVTLVVTLFTALLMATEGPESSPVMLGVWGVVTALLGRFAWVRAHR